VVGAGYIAGQYGGFRRLDHHAMEPRKLGSEHASSTEEAPGGTDVAAERSYGRSTAELIQQLFAELPIAVQHVGVVELVCPKGSSFCGDLPSAPHHGRNELRSDPFRTWDQLDLSTECLHRPDLLGREGVRRHDEQRVALHRANECER
jgi:hypothetical protein